MEQKLLTGHEEPEHWLSFDEVERLVSLFAHFGLRRVRLTGDGILHLCLGQEDRLDQRSLMRSGENDEKIMAVIQVAIDRKPEHHEFSERPERIIKELSSTGG